MNLMNKLLLKIVLENNKKVKIWQNALFLEMWKYMI